MIATTVLALLLTTVFAASGERVKCQMVPLQTSGGLMGMCCVYVKNISASDLSNSVLDKGVVHFPENKKSENKIVMPDSEDNGIVFPGNRHNENKKNQPVNRTQPGEETKNSDNATMIHFPNAVHKNTTSNKNSTVELGNRNKNDLPETCTDGKQKDLNGNCVDPF